MTLHTFSSQLQPVPPFDFDRALEFLAEFRPAMGEQSLVDRQLTKAMALDGGCMVFRLRPAGTVQLPLLDADFWSEVAWTPDRADQATECVSRFLSLEDDLQPFYALAHDDPDFAPVARQLFGYHQVRFPSPFEAACWAILSQRNLMSVSRTMKDRLTLAHGPCLDLDGANYRTFPDPARLAGLDEATINQAVRNQRKSQCILAAARAFALVDDLWLYQAPDHEVDAWLHEIDGIGAWSASFVLLRGLGRTARFPVVEKWTLEAARRVYGHPDLDAMEMSVLADRYGAYRGYWAHYLRVYV